MSHREGHKRVGKAQNVQGRHRNRWVTGKGTKRQENTKMSRKGTKMSREGTKIGREDTKRVGKAQEGQENTKMSRKGTKMGRKGIKMGSEDTEIGMKRIKMGREGVRFKSKFIQARLKTSCYDHHIMCLVVYLRELHFCNTQASTVQDKGVPTQGTTHDTMSLLPRRTQDSGERSSALDRNRLAEWRARPGHRSVETNQKAQKNKASAR